MGNEPSRRTRLAFGRIGTYSVATVGLLCLIASVFVLAYPKRIAPSTRVAGVDVSLLSREEARTRLASWWESRASENLRLVGPDVGVSNTNTTANDLGVAFDIEATLAQLPRDSVATWLGRTSGRKQVVEQDSHAVLDFSSLDIEFLDKVLKATSPGLAPARAVLNEEGSIVLSPELTTMKLVRDKTELALRDAIVGDQTCTLIAEFSKKRVPDAELEKITQIVSAYSTKFSSGDRSRSKNLKIAAEKIDGIVLLPGEQFSFNDRVGDRTEKSGFSKAGVYRQGRHEIDWGGGVCQVSTTLFNAVVRANMQIDVRRNHTFLVPYVPAGCDAAVAFGSYDFVFTNTLHHPIAIDSDYKPGKLTFTVLGTKDEGLEVKLDPVVTSSWTHEPVYVDDATLKPGEEKVIEKGGKGHKAVTTKITLRNGVEVSREILFRSHYKGGPKIIARGPTEAPKEKEREFVLPPINGSQSSVRRADFPGRPSHLGR